MSKTRAQLIKDAKAGNLGIETIQFYGNTDIKPAMQGIRKIVGVNSVDFKILQQDGTHSHLAIPRASLMEYTDETLSIYNGGYRKPTEHEKRILDEWQKISNEPSFKQQQMNDALSDGSSTFYQEKRFFSQRNALYLMGLNEEKGMKLDFNRRNQGLDDFIYDKNIKGEMPILVYKIHKL